MDSTSFICKCGKSGTWVSDGDETDPCPNCGRVYTCKYNKNNYGFRITQKGLGAKIKAWFVGSK